MRKEKYSEVLQTLPKNFLDEVSEYLNERKNESNKEGDLFLDNVAKSKKQFENSIALFKELLRIRKKKILTLVFVATETGMMKRDYENMLNFEKEVFDKLVRAFEDSDKEVARTFTGKKNIEAEKYRLVMFNQSVEQFVGMDGNLVGPFASGELANLEGNIAEIFVSGGKASFVDEN